MGIYEPSPNSWLSLERALACERSMALVFGGI